MVFLSCILLNTLFSEVKKPQTSSSFHHRLAPSAPTSPNKNLVPFLQMHFHILLYLHIPSCNEPHEATFGKDQHRGRIEWHTINRKRRLHRRDWIRLQQGRGIWTRFDWVFQFCGYRSVDLYRIYEWCYGWIGCVVGSMKCFGLVLLCSRVIVYQTSFRILFIKFVWFRLFCCI